MFNFSRTFDIIASATMGVSIIIAGLAAVTAVATEGPASQSARATQAVEQATVTKANERILMLVPSEGLIARGTMPELVVLANED